MSPARAWAEYVPVITLSWLLRLMPRRGALALGRALGRAASLVDRSHRRVAQQNLERAFGDSLSESERRRLVGRVYSHFGMVAADCMLMRWMRPRDIERLVEYEGVEHIRGAFLKGKGVLLFSGHIGNWEMAALMQGWLGYPIAMVTRTLDNPHLERLMAEGRTRSGNEVIPKRNAVRGVVRALQHGWCAAIVIDQDSRGTDPVFVEFFGRPTATTPALAILALRSGAPIVPVFALPAPGGKYRIRYLPEVPLPQNSDRDAAVVELTQACTSIIEDQVRARPECWLWMHRRWKTAPPAPAKTATAARSGGA